MGLFGTNTHMQQSGPRQLYIKIIHFFTFCGHDMARGCALPARAKCCRDFYMEDLSANIGQKEQEESGNVRKSEMRALDLQRSGRDSHKDLQNFIISSLFAS